MTFDHQHHDNAASGPRPTLRSVARKLLRGIALPAAALSLALGAGHATAASADSSGCDTFHNVCISVTGDAGQTVTISGGAQSSAFQGTMTVTGPNGLNETTPDQYFDPYGDWYTWTVNAAPTGEYCVSGYSNDDSNQGMACEQVY